MNGFARVVYYQKVEHPKKNICVTSIMEGRMKNGYFDGFARQFEAQGESHIDNGSNDKVVAVSSCKVGFWSPLRVYSSEKGKG